MSTAKFNLLGWEYSHKLLELNNSDEETKVVPVLGLNWNSPREESTPSVANGHSTREPPSVSDKVSTKTDHQDPLVRRSRYGRILKPTKT
ncbi:hypothetical protein TNIN_395731 [Trichonephila inaurata madagascariensis]|uniref:Uncharacterized protein n=1 Tax=Trichonephila inaurata madagascariensis TaxID=2747483 RepID=A0A8X7CMY7_9ARAC|nr:hypothetical protein TNIN_395731 [Trichonephila inaurata madagascariensis]